MDAVSHFDFLKDLHMVMKLAVEHLGNYLDHQSPPIPVTAPPNLTGLAADAVVIPEETP